MSAPCRVETRLEGSWRGVRGKFPRKPAGFGAKKIDGVAAPCRAGLSPDRYWVGWGRSWWKGGDRGFFFCLSSSFDPCLSSSFDP